MKSEAIVFTAPQKAELMPVEIPSPEADEVLLETLYTLVSPGTELRCLAGKEFEAFPFIAGYASVGRIIEVSAGVELPLGQLVFCGGTQKANIPRGWGGHCRHAVLTASSVTPLPPGVSPLQAVTAGLAAISYHGTKVSRPLSHEKIAVVGLGAIGHLSALCHALSGAQVVGIDTEPWRVERLRDSGGFGIVSEGSIAATVEKALGQKADMVVDATGVPAVLPQCIAAVKELSWAWNDDADHGARILIQGSYADDVSIPYRASFVRELKFLIPRNFNPKDRLEVFEFMQAGRLKTAGIITEVMDPRQAPEAYRRLLARENLLSVAFQWAA